jgi:hypothetical protein
VKYRKTKNKGKPTQSNPPHAEETHTPPIVTVDYERYAHFLEEADLTEKQTREFLQIIHNIIISFIDLGFGVHPLQQACGQGENNPSKTASSTQSVLDYPDKLLAENFEDVALREAELLVEETE